MPSKRPACSSALLFAAARSYKKRRYFLLAGNISISAKIWYIQNSLNFHNEVYGFANAKKELKRRGNITTTNRLTSQDKRLTMVNFFESFGLSKLGSQKIMEEYPFQELEKIFALKTEIQMYLENEEYQKVEKLLEENGVIQQSIPPYSTPEPDAGSCVGY